MRSAPRVCSFRIQFVKKDTSKAVSIVIGTEKATLIAHACSAFRVAYIPLFFLLLLLTLSVTDSASALDRLF